MREVRVATRTSALARAQAQMIADRLHRGTGLPVRLVPLTSDGDRTDAPLHTLGGAGVFVAAVRQALLDGLADVAVHSLKDLPTAEHPDTVVAAIPSREDPRDLLVGRALGVASAVLAPMTGNPLDGLPPGASVGTGSPRRVAFLRAWRPDLRVVSLRGNVDSRVHRALDGDLDAVVVAAAGVARLGIAVPGRELPTSIMLPAPGQGALAVETLRDPGGADIAEILAVLDDPDTRAAVTAERSLLARLEAGCSAPVGAVAHVIGGSLRLRAAVISVTGTTRFDYEGQSSADRATEIGAAGADDLLAQGADTIMGER